MRQIDIHRLADEAYVGQFYPMAVRSTGIGWAPAPMALSAQHE